MKNNIDKAVKEYIEDNKYLVKALDYILNDCKDIFYNKEYSSNEELDNEFNKVKKHIFTECNVYIHTSSEICDVITLKTDKEKMYYRIILAKSLNTTEENEYERILLDFQYVKNEKNTFVFEGLSVEIYKLFPIYLYFNKYVENSEELFKEYSMICADLSN